MNVMERRYSVPDWSRSGIMIVFFSGFISLLILFPVTVIATKLLCASCWYGVLCGFLFMLAALICHRNGVHYRLLYACGLLLNTIGNGLSLSSLYVYESMSTDVGRNIPGLLPAASLLLIGMLLLLLFPQRKKAVVLGVSVLFFIALGACVFGILDTTVNSGVVWRFSAFALILAVMFFLTMASLSAHSEFPALRAASFASFGVYLLITSIVIAVLSEGELLDCLDIFPRRDRKNKQ